MTIQEKQGLSQRRQTSSSSNSATATSTTTAISSSSAIPSNFEKSNINIELNEQKQPSENDYIIHKRQFDDNLATLAIRYDTTPEAILLANNIYTRDLDFVEYKELIIPVKPGVNRNQVLEEEKEEQKHKQMVINFARIKGVNQEIATYYLSSNDWDPKLALEAIAADEEWEKEQKENGARSTKGKENYGVTASKAEKKGLLSKK